MILISRYEGAGERWLANKKGDETEFEPMPVLPPERRSRLFARVSTLGTTLAVNGSQHPYSSFLPYQVRCRWLPLARINNVASCTNGTDYYLFPFAVICVFFYVRHPQQTRMD